MKAFWSSFALAFLIATAFQMPAIAQDKPEYRDWEASGFTGGGFARDFQFATPVLEAGQQTSRTVGMKYSSSYQVGARLTQYLKDSWAADLEFSFSNLPLTFTNLAPGVQSLSLSQYLYSFSYNVSYHFSPRSRRLRPYATAGSGALLFFLPQSSKVAARASTGLELRDSWKFTANWGGGVSYLVRDQVAIRAEALDRISGLPSYGVPSEARVTNGQYQPGMARRGLTNTWQINLGFAIQWDD
jgi:opacity protein-like surface antigen